MSPFSAEWAPGLVILSIRLSPGGVALIWHLSTEEATELVEGLECGDVCGDAGDYAYQVTPTKGSNPPETTLSLGLGRDAADVTWSFPSEVVVDMARAIREALRRER